MLLVGARAEPGDLPSQTWVNDTSSTRTATARSCRRATRPRATASRRSCSATSRREVRRSDARRRAPRSTSARASRATCSSTRSSGSSTTRARARATAHPLPRQDGVELSSGLSVRAAFALRFSDLNLLISGQITAKSKVLYLRDIARPGREARAVPATSTPTRTRSSLDGSSSGCSTATPRPTVPVLPVVRTARAGSAAAFNYVRNSVKATVDAYDGTVKFYVVDQEDPIIQAYQQAFPDLFTDGDEMPDELKEHLRYPEDLFTVQTDVYAKYHVTEPTTLLQQGRALGGLARPGSGDGRRRRPSRTPRRRATDAAARPLRRPGARIDPYYLYIRLPGDEQRELPDPPAVRAGVAGQPAAPTRVVHGREVGSRRNYGELESLRRCRQGQHRATGRSRSTRRSRTPTEISEQFTLLDQQGSRVDPGQRAADPGRDSIALRPADLRRSRRSAELPRSGSWSCSPRARPVLAPTVSEALAQFPEFAAIAPHRRRRQPTEPDRRRRRRARPDRPDRGRAPAAGAARCYADAEDAAPGRATSGSRTSDLDRAGARTSSTRPDAAPGDRRSASTSTSTHHRRPRPTTALDERCRADRRPGRRAAANRRLAGIVRGPGIVTIYVVEIPAAPPGRRPDRSVRRERAMAVRASTSASTSSAGPTPTTTSTSPRRA